MAGGYTHITIVQLAIEEAQRQKELLHQEAIQAVMAWKKFTLIGSIAPDYPYMAVADPNSTEWSNVMHKWGSLDFLRHGVQLLRDLEEREKRQKCLAWLLGFAAHVVADAVIHPIVNLKVGPYEDNKTRHRRCEMSQDVYIHRRLNLGVDINQQISTNVQETSDGRWSSRLDEDIAEFWVAILEEVYGTRQPPAQFSGATLWPWAVSRFMTLLGKKGYEVIYVHPASTTDALPRTLLPPTPDRWHRAMLLLMQAAENGEKLVPFARHLTADQGLTYPDQPDLQYILNQEVPGGGRMDLDQIVDKTVRHLVEFWAAMSLALQGRPSPLDTMANISLDTGTDANKTILYWS